VHLSPSPWPVLVNQRAVILGILRLRLAVALDTSFLFTARAMGLDSKCKRIQGGARAEKPWSRGNVITIGTGVYSAALGDSH